MRRRYRRYNTFSFFFLDEVECDGKWYEVSTVMGKHTYETTVNVKVNTDFGIEFIRMTKSNTKQEAIETHDQIASDIKKGIIPTKWTRKELAK